MNKWMLPLSKSHQLSQKSCYAVKIAFTKPEVLQRQTCLNMILEALVFFKLLLSMERIPKKLRDKHIPKAIGEPRIDMDEFLSCGVRLYVLKATRKPGVS